MSHLILGRADLPDSAKKVEIKLLQLLLAVFSFFLVLYLVFMILTIYIDHEYWRY